MYKSISLSIYTCINWKWGDLYMYKLIFFDLYMYKFRSALIYTFLYIFIHFYTFVIPWYVKTIG